MAAPAPPARALIALLLLVGLLVLVWPMRALFTGGPKPDPTTIRLTGSVEVTRLNMSPRQGGRLTEMLVAEGQTVAAGTLLARISNPTLEGQPGVLKAQRLQAEAVYADLASGARPQEIAQARARVNAARQQYDLLKEGSRPQETAAAASEVRIAQDAADQAQRDFARAQELFDGGVIPRQELEGATLVRDSANARLRITLERADILNEGARSQEIQTARANLELTQAALELLMEGPTPENLAQADAIIQRIEAQEAIAQAEVAELHPLAPRQGVVDRVVVETGELIIPGQTLCTLRIPGDVEIQAYLPEPDLPHVSIDQAVRIQVSDAAALEGSIISIASDAEFTPRNIQTPEERATQVFALRIRVTNPPEWLRDGMTVEIELERRPFTDDA